MAARIVLQPAKLQARAKCFVSNRKVGPLTLDWPELFAKLAPQGRREEGLKLRAIRSGAFVGLCNRAKAEGVVCFLLINPDHSGDLSKVLEKDPSFADRLIEVYRVEEVEWASGVQEAAPV